MKKLLEKINGGTIKVEEWILTIICTILPIIIFVSVIMRYILHENFDGLSEIVTILCAWLYFTGSAVATYENSHINASILDLFVKKEKTMAKVQVMRQVISLILYAIIFKLALENVLWMFTSNPKTPMLRLPQVIMYIPIALCFFLSVIYTIIHVVHFIQELKNPGGSADVDSIAGGETNE